MYCELVVYPQEGHGFRQYPNRRDQLKKELTFYQEQGLLSKTSTPPPLRGA